MDVQFWGVRGTFPVAGRPASRIGGNTPCATVTSGAGDVFIIDAGTGIRALGDALIAGRKTGPLRLSLLFTHFHLDHVQGLPFFAPLLLVDAEIRFYSAVDPEDMKGYLGRLMGKPYFPMPFDRTPATKSFHKIDEAGIRIDPVRISACPLHHPQGCVAYRLEENGAAVVFATDTEPDSGLLDERLTKFAGNAACLISDAMFTPEEYASGKQGWGHSTWLDGTKLAGAAGVSRLLLSHFNPDHSDRLVFGLERRARRLFPAAGCAREGLRVTLTPAGPAAHRKEADRP
jgi:phosphoribosyl 1,2-cyclic phosphodiesterase